MANIEPNNHVSIQMENISLTSTEILPLSLENEQIIQIALERFEKKQEEALQPLKDKIKILNHVTDLLTISIIVLILSNLMIYFYIKKLNRS